MNNFNENKQTKQFYYQDLIKKINNLEKRAQKAT